jgi:preprotein translocase subunit SecG
MYTLILIIHILIATVLIGLILIQRGRSGGLVEALGGVESIFGTKTSSFLVKLTIYLAILFFSTSIFLAYLSKEKWKPLIEKDKETSLKQEETTSENKGSLTEKSSEASGQQVPANEGEAASNNAKDTTPQ